MRRGSGLLIGGLAVAAVGAGAALAPSALGIADVSKIRNDYGKDRKLTRCRFSLKELEAAREIARQNPDEAYGAFASALDGELARIKAKFCVTATPESARKKSSLELRIGKISGTGDAKKESIKLESQALKAVEVRGTTLRDRSGDRVSIPKFKIPRKGTVTLRIGCGKSGDRRVYACSKGPLVDDKGDLLRLLDKKGVVASQRGSGKYAEVFRF